jgi:2-phospho-L-lactate guanylyltransferase
MSVWVIIPVKPLRLAKSRLAGVFTPEQRQQFAEAMLRHVLQVVREVPQVAGTLVISRDSKALAIAREYNANTVQESGAPELNAALTRATQVLASWKCDAVLVLPADLPLIGAEDITGIIALGQEKPSVVIATDRNRDGTNALFMRPPGLIPYAYGEGSYGRHVSLTQAVGVPFQEYDSNRLILDIDLPEDIERYTQLVGESNANGLRAFLPQQQ